MTLPGFDAEASLYRTRTLYSANVLLGQARGAVRPQSGCDRFYWKAKLTGITTLWLALLRVMLPAIEWAGVISEMKAPGRTT